MFEGKGNCPDATGTVNDGTSDAGVPCQIIPGCNFNNGSLTPLAKQCSNVFPDEDCEQLFPCLRKTSGTPGDPDCNRNDPGSSTPNDPTKYPYVRAVHCLSPAIREVALQCANTCGMCCETPEYNCDDDTNSPIDCELNKNKCKDTKWTDIMSQYCPMTCGLCTSGTCTDINSGCNTMTPLCRNMTANCARTCEYCNTTSATTASPSSGCSNIASNCVQNAHLCTNSVYRPLMLQQCCATCSGTSLSSISVVSSCSDSSASCTNWVRNGFCNNRFYTTAQKRQYCGRSCNLC